MATALAQKETARAMEWLGRAVVMGYRNGKKIGIESARDPLRSRDDFRLTMIDLTMSANLFASTH